MSIVRVGAPHCQSRQHVDCQSRQIGLGEGKVRNPDLAHKADSFRRRCSLTLGCGIVYIELVKGILVARMVDLQPVRDSAMVRGGNFNIRRVFASVDAAPR
jgi:hypothetical protein